MVGKERKVAENKDQREDSDEKVLFDASIDASETAEDAEIEDIEEHVGIQIQKYKERLKVCQKERQEYLDGWQRAKADFLNNKKRLEAEQGEERGREAARFAAALLPLADSFERALAAVQNGHEAREDWRVGLEQIYNQLANILKSYNVEAIEPIGAPFDPRLMDALSEQEIADPAQDHVVLEVLQRGYRIGERLIRPAQVVVGKYKNE